MPPPKFTCHWLDQSPDSFRQRYLYTEGPYDSPDAFECWLLTKLAQDAKCVVEIGTWRGRSACFLALGLPEDSKLICIDHFRGDSTGGNGASLERTKEVFTKFNVKAEIIEEDANRVDWSNILKEKCDLVFYDSEHTKSSTVNTLTRLHPYITLYGRVIIHDSHFPETIEAISELTKRLYHKTLTIDVWEGLTILQKI